MNALDDWNHKWFGVWREYGEAYAACPSIHDFTIPGASLHYDKIGIRQYLTQAPIVASTSKANFPNPFDGRRGVGSISFRTDGEWLWLDDLPEYIDQFGVAIPTNWLNKIEIAQYVPPVAVTQELIGKLEWPEMKVGR